MPPTLQEIHRVKLLGTGDRLVVLSHGFGGSQEMWSQVAQHLAPHFRVLLYDLRGHGEPSSSSSPAGPDEEEVEKYRTIHGFTEDLIGILTELRVEKCLYVGHSVSGMVGCLAASVQPELFDKLILVGASPRYLSDENYEGGFDIEVVEQLLRSIQEDFEAWVRSFVPVALGGEASEKAVAELTSTFLRVRPSFARVAAEAIFKSDFRDILPLVKVPCHIIQTLEDLAVPMPVALFLRVKLEGSELHILEGRGHLPHITCPELLIPVLDEILQLRTSPTPEPALVT